MSSSGSCEEFMAGECNKSGQSKAMRREGRRGRTELGQVEGRGRLFTHYQEKCKSAKSDLRLRSEIKHLPSEPLALTNLNGFDVLNIPFKCETFFSLLG